MIPSPSSGVRAGDLLIAPPFPPIEGKWVGAYIKNSSSSPPPQASQRGGPGQCDTLTQTGGARLWVGRNDIDVL